MANDEAPAEKGMEKVTTVKSPDFRQFYATSVYGNMSPVDCRITFYVEDVTVKPEQRSSDDVEVDGVQRLVQSQVFMSPYSAKLMSIWLAQQIRDYEEEYGEIKLDPRGIKRMEKQIVGYI